MANDRKQAEAPFDRDRQANLRLRWAGRGMAEASFLYDAVAAELSERLSLVQRRFETGLEIGGYDGRLARSASAQVETMIRMAPERRWLAETPLAVAGDDEWLPFRDDSLDLVLAPLTLHQTNDTPGAMAQIRRALRPDGLFLAALMGGETLWELRASLIAAEAEIYGGASPRVQPFIELRDAGALLQRTGFALPVIDQERQVVRYDTMFGLMTDLRAMGMANSLLARSRKPVGRRLFLRAAELYAQRFSDADGRVRATFDIIYLSGWKPHESQQKPLAPGSAKASLADVLKDRSGG
ncbi:methyltransferase domain-containing protein [Aureimonas sp. OT7]|uniref:class I SAM-dependent methyltransferase n=1 Tax=Aureimonas sp. OT7 TaxID=2816454 RepID=UPI001FEDF676|nr:methyltransferase domain-containing protein [Aureimonas sp. OT7]